jgi:hypothetical protein
VLRCFIGSKTLLYVHTHYLVMYIHTICTVHVQQAMCIYLLYIQTGYVFNRESDWDRDGDRDKDRDGDGDRQTDDR